MTEPQTQPIDQVHPRGLDSIDFYVRRGHALHARALRESLQAVFSAFRDRSRRRRRSRAIV